MDEFVFGFELQDYENKRIICLEGFAVYFWVFLLVFMSTNFISTRLLLTHTFNN